MSRILGIDPGLTRLGFGGIKSVDGSELELIAHGFISHTRKADAKFNEHLTSGIKQITNDFPRVIDIVGPDCIYAEIVPVGRLGSNSELNVGAITTCKVIAFQFGIPWHDVGSNTWKKALVDDGKATKAVVKNKVFELFPEVEERHTALKKQQKADGEKAVGLPQDVFDALGIATAGVILESENQDVQDV